MPSSDSCSQCHTVPGDFSIAALAGNTILHTGISSGCRACHVAGTGAGPFAGCATQATCASPVPLSYQPKVMPLLAGGSPTSPSSSTHVPVGTVACEACHSATNFSTFGGTNMKPPTGTPMHTAVNTQTCMSCHEKAYTWFGVSIRTRPSEHSGSRAAPNDCNNSGCHKVASSFSNMMRIRPVMRAAVNRALPRLLPQTLLLPGGAASSRRFDHLGVAKAQCQTCHNGQLAQGRPAHHYGSRLSCDSCHRSTAWSPAQFSHPVNAAGQCAACHNGVDASGRPGTHFVTVRSCDACHRTLAWQPASYQHLSPAYQPTPDRLTCVSCHITNGEVIPRQMHANPRNRPIPVKP